ncbi:MAG: peptidyl-tRNA hydrolase [Cytophagales bacterium]|nr:peptidyl-tRNA hydrolase [Cytophagales bacterium]
MKMYILLKDSVPDEFAPVIAAHASLACYKQYESDPDMQTWINSVFKKVVCRVNDKEFIKANETDRSTLLTESALENQEVALAFCPRKEYPQAFKFFRKWRPQ